ncbi:transglutaminase-like domain-containing protein [Calditrichota bacterium GD2]
MKTTKVYFVFILFLIGWSCNNDPLNRVPVAYLPAVQQALQRAGENQRALLEFLKACKGQEMEGAAFLLAYMPQRDLQSLSPEFLIENIKYAYQSRKVAPWGKRLPDSIFFNYVLPYASIHERRDDWRKQFYERFLSLVKNASSPGEAAVILNEKIWDMLDVHYSTKRPKADQSPFESIEAGMASCTGLSILLVDACRAVSVPARFVSAPMWYDDSGNHSWVEIWDNGWHFIGAGEPGPLDETWFVDIAGHANKRDWKYRIYAVSYKKTALQFPDFFAPAVDYLYAIDVTDRYSRTPSQLQGQNVALRIKVLDRKSGQRLALPVRLFSGKTLIASGRSRGERNDLNDVLTLKAPPGAILTVEVINNNGKKITRQLKTGSEKIQQVILEVD